MGIFGKSKSDKLNLIEKYNTNPKSEIISFHFCEIHKLSSEVLKGLSPALSAFTAKFIWIIILDDSIIFSSNINDEKSLKSRMFWNEADKYEFKINVYNKLFKKEIVIEFIYDNKNCKVKLFLGKENTDYKMTEKTLSFIQKKIIK